LIVMILIHYVIFFIDVKIKILTIVENDVNALCDEHITITESDAIFGYKGRTLCVICLL